ncbi:stromal membrane-associated protein 1 isoform X2 [Alosa alosa]|uniref:stromal membrane-associated protein 1 isoform X2 n=1 Tax=Alosa alosa TaxID=278164 RepID=UPI0020150935|nr:stromal membrane-associated protein 1 isoform X2 [Alosa alosa]
MTTRSEREKAQKLNEQHQAILSKMLREDDNKYCADCEAKGPRWASWNLGVFICIRCAGIHRNLGVHISRVKSVNLDQWTPEQMQSVQDMGNTRARQLYEAHLPENFRRPQTDQAVEFFIRDKYEKKKYYDKNAINGSIKAPDVAQSSSSSSPSSQASEKNKLEEREKKKDERKREKDTDKSTKPSPLEKKREDVQSDSKPSPRKNAEPSVDLLGLDAPAAGAAGSAVGAGGSAPISDDLDIFGPMVSNPLPSSASTNQASSSKAPGVPAAAVAAPGAPSGAVVEAAPTSSSQGELDLFSEGGGGKAEENAKKPLSKDSILSLYGSSTVPQQPTQAAMFIGRVSDAVPHTAARQLPGLPGHGRRHAPHHHDGRRDGPGGRPGRHDGPERHRHDGGHDHAQRLHGRRPGRWRDGAGAGHDWSAAGRHAGGRGATPEHVRHAARSAAPVEHGTDEPADDRHEPERLRSAHVVRPARGPHGRLGGTPLRPDPQHPALEVSTQARDGGRKRPKRREEN